MLLRSSLIITLFSMFILCTSARKDKRSTIKRGKTKIRIAINGFGRIGRNFSEQFYTDKEAQKKLDVVVINIGPADPNMIAHMFKYDTLFGTLKARCFLRRRRING